jgi:hypothetical protein
MLAIRVVKLLKREFVYKRVASQKVEKKHTMREI